MAAAPEGTFTVVWANNAILPLARNGTATLGARAFVAGGGQVDLILDTSGYFE